MRKIGIVLFIGLGLITMLNCHRTEDKNDQKKEKDKGPIYMRPLHHSKDTATV